MNSGASSKRCKKGSTFQHLLCCVMPVIPSPSSPTAPMTFADPGVSCVLSSLDQLSLKAGGERPDLAFLKDLLESSDFLSLLKVHEKVTTPDSPDEEIASCGSQDLLYEVCDELQNIFTEDAQELLCLLLRPHMKALIEAHDAVAQKGFIPELPEVPHEVDEDDESAIKIVRLMKGPQEPLGATIHLNEETGIARISRVLRGGAADRCGMIHVGDEVQEVNGVKVCGMETEHIVKLLSNAVGQISLKLIPATGDNEEEDVVKRVRAQFSYNPANDQNIPCKEAGLSFSKGDILHVVATNDSSWWQAKRQDDLKMRAGLIPSQELQEKRSSALKAISSVNNNKETKEGKTQRTWFSPRISKKSKKNRKSSQSEETDENDQSLVYEELALLHPADHYRRPVVLIGPAGVGRTSLKSHLIESNSARYQAPVPHTSRPMKSSEEDGQDFIFISKTEMEKEIENKKFFEYGEFNGHYYGTSTDQIKSVMHACTVCIICPQPQALKVLRCAEIKPYVVMVKPPEYDILKETRLSNENCTESSSLSDEDMKEMIASANQMENQYAHCIDYVIINGDLQRTVNELGEIILRIEQEPHWVPADWIKS